MHCLVATKILANPALIARARGTLERRKVQILEPVPAFLEWGQVLAGSLEEIVDLPVSTGEDSTRLRQSSPFTGILTAEELEGLPELKTGSIRDLRLVASGYPSTKQVF